jgi:tetratricopeptide (TPR) repeat protein
MIDDFLKSIYKNNKIIGIILLGIFFIAYIIEIINNLASITQINFHKPWFPIVVIVLLLFLISVSKNKTGDISYNSRILARACIIFLILNIILFVTSFLLLQREKIYWIVFFYTSLSSFLFVFINYCDRNSKEFKVLFCEFSDSACEDKPKDRHITYYVRQELKKEFYKNPPSIIDVDKVVIDDSSAYRLGVNSGSKAVIYGIYTKVQKQIKLDLRFLVISKPKYYQQIKINKRILPIEELDSGVLEHIVSQDYSIAIDFLFGLFDYSSMKYENAIIRFSNVLNNMKNDIDYQYSIAIDTVNLYLGNSYFLNGDFLLAKETYAKSLIDNPNLAKITHNLGVIEYQKENYKNSISLFSEAISMDPNLLVSYRNRGFVLFHESQFDSALKDFLIFKTQMPYDAEVNYLIGSCYSNLNNYDFARKYFKLAYKISQDKSLFLDIGEEFFSQHDYVNAILVLLQVLFLPKYFFTTLEMIIDYSLELNHSNISLFLICISIFFQKNNAHLYFSRGHIYSQKGLTKKAISDFQKAIKIDPYFSDAYYNLGNMLMLINEIEYAIEKYTNCLRLTPNFADAIINRAQAYFLLKQINLAISDAEKYLSLTIDEDGIASCIIGYGLIQNGSVIKGLDQLRNAYKIHPTEELKRNIENIEKMFCVS